MLKQKRTFWIFFPMVIVTLTMTAHIAHSKDSIKELINQYQQAATEEQKLGVAKKLGQTEPVTGDDMNQLRTIFQKKEWDEGLYGAGVMAIEKIKDPSLDDTLIEILKDEKPLMEKASPKDFVGKTERELAQRSTNVMFIIQKLGLHKSQKAVPILKEYLMLRGFQYYASEALAKIGDKSASEEIRERAYRGEEVIYGGQGLDEAIKVVRDLEDESKKDKWNKIAGQLKSISDSGAKPYLKKLFEHKTDFVREQAAIAFTNMVDKSDSNDLIEMTKNNDDNVRSRAIHAMMVLKDVPFDDVLIQILTYDSDWLPRSKAARALGYKKVSKSVPYLEKALNDKDYYVRLEAFISLYVLTGKKYDFKGRDATADSMAERQSKSPNIYW